MQRTALRIDPLEAADDDLARRVGQGDRLAFAELFLHHHDAAWGMANVVSGFSVDAEIAVIQGVAVAWAAMPAPDDDVRPHLLAGVRRAALERQSRTGRTAGWAGRRAGELAGAGADGNLVRRFLRRLPEQWRSALWLTQVEDLTAGEVAFIVGLEPASVPTVASFAWEALRDACVDSYQRVEAPAQCRPTVDRIGPYLKGELTGPARFQFEAHCDDCAACGLRLAVLDPIPGLLGAVPPDPLLGPEAQSIWLALLNRLGPSTTPEVHAPSVPAGPRPQ